MLLLSQVVTDSTASFTVDTKGLDGDLDIRVTGPDGGQIPARLVKLRSGLHRAEYRADQVGGHKCMTTVAMERMFCLNDKHKHVCLFFS